MASKVTDRDPTLADIAGPDSMAAPDSPTNGNRRASKEWDASKVPPSRFQKREGSIYSTPQSRDSHIKGTTRDQAYHDKMKEKVCACRRTGCY